MPPDAFSTVETQPWNDVHALQLARLPTQLAYLLDHSAFYQSKLAAAKVSRGHIRSLADLRRVPFTSKQELRDSLKAAPLLGLHRAAPAEDIVQIQASSGT